MVVTELERITADPAGAAGAVWRGRDEGQTLSEAVDNPDGVRLYQVQLREVRRREAERDAAEREAQRPVCTQCGIKFTDERRQETKRSAWPGEWDRLCGPCKREAADRAEAERSHAAGRRKPNARQLKRRR
ncbi:hypothetical protein SUDANB178_07465 [Streptomyces sp. enrichment culture]